MGKDLNPCRLGNKRSNSMIFPQFVAEPYGLSLHVNSYPAVFASGVEKSCVVLDRSRNHTSLIFDSLGSRFPNPNPSGHGLDMREDSEEINALLYSDSENEYQEQGGSIGHSPVASSAVMTPPLPPPKRRRVESRGHDPSLADSASSAYRSDNDNDGRKRAKREKIQETVGVLRGLIPGGRKGKKDASEVLEEAIRYLKSLKLKAKNLGVTSL